ncbi:MAG: Rrf2 family transcriptional regulator [Clostridia bacterium]|nr:Rrf2 family transcriptional regulator [Clostridia bacterium]
MRITLESDYALRIITSLATHDSVVDAKTLAEETSVTQRFTLKILHKLVTAGLVISFKGVNGGYKLGEPSDKITLKEVIELIDGPIMMVRCLESSESCALNKDKTACIYHHIFDTISLDVAKKLSVITISDVINKNYKI